MPKSYVDQIVAVFDTSEAIAGDQVLAWMTSDDHESLGALYNLLTREKHSRRITPPLTFEQYQSFARDYFGRCLRDDPQGPWSNSRYVAGWDLVGWLAKIWSERETYPKAMAEWKRWLEATYRDGDAEIRTCLVNATLEHLFEQPGMGDYFRDWKDDAVLAEAYELALDWTARGGMTPLGKPKRPKRTKR